ncbi:MAG: YicC family protein [Deltaproteobacteria bacterium]|nr:YicC family protein [Deltaproteobacteria bacterium]MBI3387318.1 YicC family protein [Deltaproteobacteria bacterium]
MRSMTGFGQAIVEADGRRITIEVRSVNQRFLDVKLNMPREYMPWEKDLRAAVQAVVGRGKVDVSINRNSSAAGEISVEINQTLAQAYMRGLRDLQAALGLGGQIELAMVMARPDVLRVVERRGDPQSEIAVVRGGLSDALAKFNHDREREGRSLARDLAKRVKHLRQIERRMRAQAARVAPALTRRLRDRMRELLDGVPVNEERLLQEVAILAERADITEELVRLDSHLEAMEQAFASKEPAGRQLDFLLQEIHREINTIASKSADIEMTNLSIAAKGEAEKLREQAQNVE